MMKNSPLLAASGKRQMFLGWNCFHQIDKESTRCDVTKGGMRQLNVPAVIFEEMEKVSQASRTHVYQVNRVVQMNEKMDTFTS